jgi:hypothetical protein
MPKTPLFFAAVISLISVSSAASFNPTTDAHFAAEISERVAFPVLPPGGCLEGSHIAARYICDREVIYCYDPGDGDWRGHVWLLVGDGEGGYQAVDSYYGPVRDPEYYEPPMTARSYDELVGLIPAISV